MQENQSENENAKEKDPKTILQEEWKPQKQEWFIMLSLGMISLVVALDATILVASLPTIAEALHGNTIDAFWAGTSYLLTNAVFQPVIASVSELFGRQQLLLISLSFFTLGSILCAVANDFQLLLAGRSIQGVGGGGITTMCQVIFCDIVPLRLRPKFFSIVLGAWSIGSILGPLVGGLFCQNSTWRWIFYINFPFCFLGYLLTFAFVKLNAVAKLTLAEKLRNTDWIGAFLFVGSMTSFLVGVSWGGVQYSWSSVQTLAPMIFGIAGVIGFYFWQISVSPRSLLPISLFSCPSIFIAFYCAFVNGLLLYAGIYYAPFYFISVRMTSATRAGVNMLPALVFLVPGSIMTAALTTRLGRFRWAIWAGLTIVTIGSGLLLLLRLHTETAVWAVAFAVFGLGSGMMLTSVNIGVQAISKVEDSAMAASMYGFFRSLGMPFGVALAGTVFQNTMSTKLKSAGLPVSISHDSERYAQVLRTMSPDDPRRIATLDAYVYGFRGVWILITCFGASALVASAFFRKFDMNKTLVAKYTARQISTD